MYVSVHVCMHVVGRRIMWPDIGPVHNTQCMQKRWCTWPMPTLMPQGATPCACPPGHRRGWSARNKDSEVDSTCHSLLKRHCSPPASRNPTAQPATFTERCSLVMAHGFDCESKGSCEVADCSWCERAPRACWSLWRARQNFNILVASSSPCGRPFT